MHNLLERFAVEVGIAKDKNQIAIYGSIEEISTASDYLYTFFRDAECQIQKQLQAERMSDYGII